MNSARLLCRSLGKLRSTALGEIAESKRLAFLESQHVSLFITDGG